MHLHGLQYEYPSTSAFYVLVNISSPNIDALSTMQGSISIRSVVFCRAPLQPIMSNEKLASIHRTHLCVVGLRLQVCLAIVFYIYAVHLFSICQAQSAIPISLNSTQQGNTSEAPAQIFQNFLKIDVTSDEIGVGGQLLYELEIQDDVVDLELSTCLGSDFDTYLALLDRNPINNTSAFVISESGNDISCKTGKSKAFLSTRIALGIYYIIVTGNGAKSGFFNLTVKGSPPSPTPLPWGIDRIDQRLPPLDGKYSVPAAGENVWVYLVDSGVRSSHDEFEGRVTEGFDFVNIRKDSAPDCTGHGTHVAGIIAGKSFGVAKKARVIAVRAFGCDNTAKTSVLVDSMGWIIADVRAKSRRNVIIALMFSSTSLESSTLGSTVRGLIRTGIPVIVPAGNDGSNACDFYPGSLNEFMTVASTEISDSRSSFSNFGNCANVYAPGGIITSSWHTGDYAARVLSGTAQAAAHMVGVVANLLDLNNGIRGDVVNNVVESISTKNIVGNTISNETTRFAFVRSVPRYSGQSPSQGKVFLFTILGIDLRSCSPTSEKMTVLARTFAELLSIADSKVVVDCLSGDDYPRDEDLENVEVQMEVPERNAASAFAILESALQSEKEDTVKSVGFSFVVRENPWAVDSTPIVFWGAPSFSETEYFSLSKGAIAGAAVGGICLFAILLAASWILYRKISKIDEIESMEGSADLEKGPVLFDDFGNRHDDGGSSAPKSFRNVVRAMSFRRSFSMKAGSGANDQKIETGMNRMGSFIGGPDAAVAKDVVRMESFGGEAFAGMASLSRSSSVASSSDERGNLENQSMSSGDLALSFRGLNNLVLSKGSSPGKDKESSGRSENDGFDEDESLRMQSLGGEAFAMVGRQLSLVNRSDLSKKQPRDRKAGDQGDNSATSNLPIIVTKGDRASEPDIPSKESFFGGFRQRDSNS